MNEKLIIKSSVKIIDSALFLNGYVELYDVSANVNFNSFIRNAYNTFKVNYPKFFKMDNLSKLGFLTAEMLFKNNKITGKYKGEDIGIIISNASSSLDTDINYNNTIKDKNDYFPSPSVFVYTLPNIMIGEICIRHKITGENCFFVWEKFNAEFIYKYVTDLFEQNKLQCCITGWVDLLDDNYNSILYLIEKRNDSDKTNESITFDPENLNRIYLEQ